MRLRVTDIVTVTAIRPGQLALGEVVVVGDDLGRLLLDSLPSCFAVVEPPAEAAPAAPAPKRRRPKA